MSGPYPRSVVIGDGIEALTVAIELQNRGFAVDLLSPTFPSDSAPQRVSLYSAAAYSAYSHHDSVKYDLLIAKTLNRFWSESQRNDCSYMLKSTVHFHYFDSPNYPLQQISTFKDFKRIPEKELPKNAKMGFSYTSVVVDTVRYQQDLLRRFQESGGHIFRRVVRHLSEVLECGAASSMLGRLRSPDFKPPQAIVLCPGLDAKSIGAVEDSLVYPVRRYTVTLRTPWVSSAIFYTCKDDNSVSVIPLPSKQVVISGHLSSNDWLPVPRPGELGVILSRALTICPELIPDGSKHSVTTLLSFVMEESCDIFAARHNEPNLGKYVFDIGQTRVPVMYNYGHGPAAVESCWGCAEFITSFLMEDVEAQNDERGDDPDFCAVSI
ncbi:hypothetical protein BKA70DRAFT_1418807 [Coprinopsis sp. MPI-PUGE-AT-0042]|nr:hypothetical protein BKA70DRAFT_1418807 [Coprinopsis sp. MPI-PUGE-AT-0042]